MPSKVLSYLFFPLFVVGLCLSGASDVNAQVAPEHSGWTLNASGTITSILPSVVSDTSYYFALTTDLAKSQATNLDMCSGSSASTANPENVSSLFLGKNLFTDFGLGSGSNPSFANCSLPGTYFLIMTGGLDSGEYTARYFWEVQFDGFNVTTVNPPLVIGSDQSFQYSTQFRADCSYMDGPVFYLCTDIASEDLDEAYAERWPTGISVTLSLSDAVNFPFAVYQESLDESCDSMGCVGTSTTNANIDTYIGTSTPNSTIIGKFRFYNADIPTITPFPRATAEVHFHYDENGEISGVSYVNFTDTDTSTGLDSRPFVECSLDKLAGCFQNFFIWLWWPSDYTFDTLGETRTTVLASFPTSLVYGTLTGIATLDSPASSTLPAFSFQLFNATTTIDMISAFEGYSGTPVATTFDHLRDLVALLFWTFILLYFYHRYTGQ